MGEFVIPKKAQPAGRGPGLGEVRGSDSHRETGKMLQLMAGLRRIRESSWVPEASSRLPTAVSRLRWGS